MSVDVKGQAMVTPAAAPSRAWVGWAIALIASVTFSVATPLMRAALTSGVNSTQLLLIRMGVATILMGITIALMDRRLLRADRRCLSISLVAGSSNGVGMLFYIWGVARLESSVAAMLISVSPLVVLSYLALRGERVTYRHAIRLALALGGVYLLIGPSGTVDLIGVAWIVASMLLFGLQMALLQWYLMEYDAKQVTFYVLVAMTAAVVVLWATEGATWPPLSTYGWVAGLVLAVFSTYISRLLLFTAVSRIGGGQMAMLSPVETLLAVLWSALFLGERFTWIQWAGGALILISAVLALKRLSIARLRPRWRLWAKS
jgi:drug/metabolite transporter (DMT)-like permease